MAIAYENGVNLFDTAEVYASGRSDFLLKQNQIFFSFAIFLILLNFPLKAN